MISLQVCSLFSATIPTIMSNNYQPHRFPYEWYLRDGYPAKGIEPHNSTVFGTFICGGGSSMGYKLAGFHHLGGVELDPKVAEVYKQNHHPEYLYNMDIREFNQLQDLPAELYNLDILDGSPPCSTFSTAGSRDKAWGKEKQFAEGQKLQTLDDLVFIYCDTILKLKPKCFILENVSGLVKGNAKSYAKRIVKYLDENGYAVQVFLLNGATMGVPQTRERVFFIGHRKEFKLPKLVLDFNEKPILFGEVMDKTDTTPNLSEFMMRMWKQRKKTDTDFRDIIDRVEHRCSMFNNKIFHADRVGWTIASSSATCNALYDIPRSLNRKEILSMSTFPQDYKNETKQIGWLCGMSVPPVMTAQISYQIYKQWLLPIKSKQHV